jgi:protein-S-isoprenylcysteine O-methyltransferase Ste14
MVHEHLLRSFAAVRGAVYAAVFIWLWVWLAILARQFDAQFPFTMPSALRPIGAALAAVGAVLTLSCVAVFATSGRGTPAPFDAPRFFVASGPYRMVRNPMYLGASLVMVGAGLYLGSPSVLLLAGCFLLLAHCFVLLYEEPTLRNRFGDSYEQYTRSVHRWLPRLTLATVLVIGVILAAALLISLLLSAPSGILDDSF